MVAAKGHMGVVRQVVLDRGIRATAAEQGIVEGIVEGTVEGTFGRTLGADVGGYIEGYRLVWPGAVVE